MALDTHAKKMSLSIESLSLSIESLSLSIESLGLSIESLDLSIESLGVSIESLDLSIESLSLSIESLSQIPNSDYFKITLQNAVYIKKINYNYSHYNIAYLLNFLVDFV